MRELTEQEALNTCMCRCCTFCLELGFCRNKPRYMIVDSKDVRIVGGWCDLCMMHQLEHQNTQHKACLKRRANASERKKSGNKTVTGGVR